VCLVGIEGIFYKENILNVLILNILDGHMGHIDFCPENGLFGLQKPPGGERNMIYMCKVGFEGIFFHKIFLDVLILN